MTHEEALRQIIREASDYAALRERFQPFAHNQGEALHDLHVWRQGYRDGQLAAARVAKAALEPVAEVTGE